MQDIPQTLQLLLLMSKKQIRYQSQSIKSHSWYDLYVFLTKFDPKVKEELLDSYMFFWNQPCHCQHNVTYLYLSDLWCLCCNRYYYATKHFSKYSFLSLIIIWRSLHGVWTRKVWAYKKCKKYILDTLCQTTCHNNIDAFRMKNLLSWE